jgi:hypothetical protein
VLRARSGLMPTGARRRVVKVHPLPGHIEAELLFDGLDHLRGLVKAGQPLDDKRLYRPGEFFGRRHKRKTWSKRKRVPTPDLRPTFVSSDTCIVAFETE